MEHLIPEPDSTPRPENTGPEPQDDGLLELVDRADQLLEELSEVLFLLRGRLP